MREYVELLAARNDKLGSRCKKLLDEFLENHPTKESEETLMAKPTTNLPKNETNSIKLFIASWMTYLLGLLGGRPLIPRGRLDISYSDLWFALCQCFLQCY